LTRAKYVNINFFFDIFVVEDEELKVGSLIFLKIYDNHFFNYFLNLINIKITSNYDIIKRKYNNMQITYLVLHLKIK